MSEDDIVSSISKGEERLLQSRGEGWQSVANRVIVELYRQLTRRVRKLNIWSKFHPDIGQFINDEIDRYRRRLADGTALRNYDPDKPGCVIAYLSSPEYILNRARSWLRRTRSNLPRIRHFSKRRRTPPTRCRRHLNAALATAFRQ